MQITESVLTDLPHQRISIEILSDDALLEIFEIYLSETQGIDGWHMLVHVCQRWRNIVFASPRRLNLRLLCTQRTPVRKTLDIWPAFPIIISSGVDSMTLAEGGDNIMAALEHSDRVEQIFLYGVTSSLLRRLASVAKGPFPRLTNIDLCSSNDASMPVLPDSFLNRSAPRLLKFRLSGIPFPALPELLLSSHHLVNLDLSYIPASGYISHEAIAICLPTLTRLQDLRIEFNSPRSRADRASQRQLPPTRTVLPVLTSFAFKGDSEYLGYLMARLHAPLLNKIAITFFNQLILDISYLPRLIGFAESFQGSYRAEVVFQADIVTATFKPQEETVDSALLIVIISCRESDWQLSSLAQVCTSALPPSCTLELLDITEDRVRRPHWQDDMDHTQWLELLRPLTSLEELDMSRELVLRVAPALQGLVDEEVMEVLPALHSVFIRDFWPSGLELVRETIGKFLAARQTCGHPVAFQDPEIESGWGTVSDDSSDYDSADDELD